MELKIRFLNCNPLIVTNNIKNYREILDKLCISYYLPIKYSYRVVNINEKADICICGVEHTDESLLKNDEVNILISPVDINYKKYPFYEKFKQLYNSKINIFIQSHICNFNYEKSPFINNPTFVPAIFLKCKYFKENENKYLKIMNTSFQDKKFCLVITRNRDKENMSECIQTLLNIGQVDFINQAKFDYLLKHSCYESIEFLKLLNKYKFVLTFESSICENHITEKIFNVFFAKSIPIYQGAPNISRYISNNSFLQYDKTLQHKLRVINASKSIYDKIVNTNKIEYNYANMYLEHYLDPYLNKEKQVTGFKEQKTQRNLYQTGYL